MLRYPPGDSLPYLHLELVKDFGMRILRGAKHEIIVLENEYEAGIATYQVGDELDDFVKHLVQGICCRNAGAEIMQKIKSGIKV